MADQTQDSIIREIDEELRHEQYSKLWKKYGAYVIGAVAVLVIGVAGYQGWRSYDINSRMADGEQFAEAQRLAADGKTEAAVQAFGKLAEDAGSGYGLLARFQEAAASARAGDRERARFIYRGLAEDGGIDPVYRDLAVILEALHAIDDGDPGALKDRLAPLMLDDNPWRHSAREISALIAQRGGDAKSARELYGRLAGDPTAPQGVRTRAAEMLAVLGE